MTNAGYKIIAQECFETGGKDVEYYIVLGHMVNQYGEDQYVTWEGRRWIPKDGPRAEWSFYWGHYIEDKGRAYKDYHERLASEYERQIDENDRTLVLKEV